ncbi:THAP domain-containing protein 3-like isoform X3 [Dermacentor variabilis]|uniref:THAP domain-containing protein 3-like isoform X3 n=1 Tax=Dermacentor variabilis TaxID=34621 RepID=UPI003F5C47F8
MTGCCVLMCPGSTRKGLRCFRFPRDPERRKKWEAQLKRDRWKATDHSYICELHFEPSQFEQRRADGWKKLKQNAIPTLFANNTQPPKQQTEQADHKPEALMSFCEVVLTYESYSSGTGSTTVTIHQIAEQGEPLTPH